MPPAHSAQTLKKCGDLQGDAYAGCTHAVVVRFESPGPTRLDFSSPYVYLWPRMLAGPLRWPIAPPAGVKLTPLCCIAAFSRSWEAVLPTRSVFRFCFCFCTCVTDHSHIPCGPIMSIPECMHACRPLWHPMSHAPCLCRGRGTACHGVEYGPCGMGPGRLDGRRSLRVRVHWEGFIGSA